MKSTLHASEQTVTLNQVYDLLHVVVSNQEKQGRQILSLEKKLDGDEKRLTKVETDIFELRSKHIRLRKDIKLLIDQTVSIQESLEEVRGAQNRVIDWLESFEPGTKQRLEILEMKSGVYRVSEKHEMRLPKKLLISKKNAKNN